MGQDQLREPGKVSYVPCPECSNLMNRVNFARCSGVVVDICKGHGTWFDRDELSRIVEFIQSGGLQTSRKKEKIELEEERRRLQQEQAALDRRRALTNEEGMNEGRLAGIASARGLLKLLMK
jgi:Zn-finger nucleic acid-binding protein